MRIVLFTDMHYARGFTIGSRTCFQSLDKLAAILRECGPADAFINLGDLVNDVYDDAANTANIAEATAALRALPAPCYSVAGNHDADLEPKAVFTGHEAWYSFELGGVEFIALDGCFLSSGASYSYHDSEWTDSNITPDQLDWLRGRLAAQGGPVVIMSHQLMTGELSDPHTMRNRDAVQQVILASARPVLALLQGHYHPGDVRALGGIPSYIFPAVCEGEGCPYAVIDVDEHGLRIEQRMAAFEGGRNGASV